MNENVVAGVGVLLLFATIFGVGGDIFRILRLRRRHMDDSYGYNPLRDAPPMLWCRKTAQRRSKALLRQFLSAEQLRQFDASGSFYVYGGRSCEKYRITQGEIFNVDWLAEDNSLKAKLCFVPSDPSIPVFDQMLAQKLMLELDEDTVHGIANIQNISEGSFGLEAASGYASERRLPEYYLDDNNQIMGPSPSGRLVPLRPTGNRHGVWHVYTDPFGYEHLCRVYRVAVMPDYVPTPVDLVDPGPSEVTHQWAVQGMPLDPPDRPDSGMTISDFVRRPVSRDIVHPDRMVAFSCDALTGARQVVIASELFHRLGCRPVCADEYFSRQYNIHNECWVYTERTNHVRRQHSVGVAGLPRNYRETDDALRELGLRERAFARSFGTRPRPDEGCAPHVDDGRSVGSRLLPQGDHRPGDPGGAPED